MTPMVIRNPPIPMVFPVQFSRSGKIVCLQALTARVQQAERGEDAERTQGGDEGWQFQSGDQGAVEPPAQGADGETDDQSEDSGHTIVGCKVGHHQHRQDRDRANGEVDSCCEDDQRLTDGQRCDDGDLLQDQ